jgi:SAM-dependent methyltransferase
MSTTELTPFARYLLAKRSVDDRALNQGVYAALAAALQTTARPLRILEIGCGVGTMLDRLARWGLLDGQQADYLGIDNEASNIASAQTPQVSGLQARFEAADFYTFARRAEAQDAYDLIIAHAVLDLLDLKRALPLMRGLLRPGGLGWFTINFDGVTIFDPPVVPPSDPPNAVQFDDVIVAAYHATMDDRRIEGAAAGESATGRRLFTALPAAGLPILSAGASDWVVFPQNGAYAGNEGYFLESILGFFASALQDAPPLAPGALDAWLRLRRTQVARAELIYIAHQFDFLVERPAEVKP